MQLFLPPFSNPTPEPQPTETQKQLLERFTGEMMTLGELKDASQLEYPELEKRLYEMRKLKFVDYTFHQRDGVVVMVWYRRRF